MYLCDDNVRYVWVVSRQFFIPRFGMGDPYYTFGSGAAYRYSRIRPGHTNNIRVGYCYPSPCFLELERKLYIMAVEVVSAPDRVGRTALFTSDQHSRQPRLDS